MKSVKSRLIKILFTFFILAFGAHLLRAQQIAVSPGIITTIAGIPGSTTVGSAGNCSGAATSCSLYYASGDLAQKVAIDNAGNIYFADRYFNVVRKLTPMTAPGTGSNLYGAGATYTMTTVAGSPTQTLCPGTANAAAGLEAPSYGDGCAATSALLSAPYAVALNSAGTILFISDLSHGTVRAVNVSSTTQTFGSITMGAGNIYTVAGTGSRAAPTDHADGSSIATSDPIYGAHGISVDPAGNLIIADSSANTIRKLIPSAQGNTMITIVGGTSTSAASPVTVSTGSACTTTALAYGSAPCGDGNPAGPPTTASTKSAVQLNSAEYAVIDSAGNIYISDAPDYRIRAVNGTSSAETLFGVPIAPGTIGTIGGKGVSGAAGDGGNAAEDTAFPTTSATVNGPNTLVFDAAGALYFADVYTNEVRRIDPTGTITTLAGHYGSLTTCGLSSNTIGDGCPATGAPLKSPTGAVLDSFGNIFILDAGNSVVREVSATTSALAFGNQTFTTTSSPQTLTIYNTGAKSLNLSSLTISGSFSQSGGTCTASSQLAPGANCTIAVVFTPQTTGALTGSVNVTSNATNVLNISLTGTGTLAPSTTTESIAPNPVNLGQSTTITATVQGSYGTPTGTVTFTVGANTFGPVNLTASGTGTATATYSTSTLLAGTYPVTVSYSGSSNYAASASSSTTLTVSSVPTTTTILSITSGAPVYGQPVSFNATVNSTASATGSVTFMDGSVVLGIVPLSGASASLTVVGLPLGNNSLTATYSGDTNNRGSVSSAVAATLVEGPAVMFTPATISTVVGNGLLGYTGDGSAATSASLNSVNGLALDATGNIYVVDTGNNAVRVTNMQKTAITVAGVTIAPGAIATVVGNGSVCTPASYASSCGDGGKATLASLNGPVYLRLDAAGNIYIADTGDNALRVVNTQTFPITVAGTTIAPSAIAAIAGNGTACATPTGANACGDGGPAASSLLKTPRGVFVDPIGNIYIADNADYRVRMINAATNIISTVAGTGSGCGGGTQACGDGGAATAATLGSVHAVYVDAKGQIYIADDTNERVRLVNTSGIISTIFGNGTGGAPVPGPATSTPLDFPGDMIPDGAGNLYVPLQYNVIAMINTSGIMTFIAGTGSPNPLVAPGCTKPTATAVSSCYSGDGGNALQALLNSPQSIAMDSQGNLYFTESGNGIVRKISIGSSVAAFANQAEGTSSSAQTINVMNTGGQPLQISQISFPTGFIQETVGSDCAAGTLAPASSCSLGIGFMPPSATAFSGSAAITSNSVSATGGTNLISLSGTGTYVTPVVTLTPSLSFGNQPVGVASSAQALTLTNTGTSPYPITSAVLGDTTNFKQTNNCPAVLAASASCTYSVVFAPTVAGSIMTNLIVTDATDSVSAMSQLSGTGTLPTANFSVTNLALGTQPVGATSSPQSITITNGGQAPLVISSITVTGANPTDFGQTSNCIASIAPAASCVIQVTFTPASVSNFTANLVVSDNATGSTQTVALTGTGVAKAPSIAFSPATLAFGNVSVGTSSAPQMLTVTNNGTANLTFSGISITGSGYGETTTCGAQLTPGSTCTVSVVFTPVTATLSAGALNFTDNAASTTQVVNLSGTGTAPQAVISPNPINFGSQSTTVASSPLVVTVSNPGNAALAISGIAITGANANLFSQTNNCGATLAIGASCVVSLTFAPTVNGNYTANLVVSDNATGSPQSAAITGVGTAPTPAVTLSSNSLDFGQIALGSASTVQTLTLTNSGSATLTLAGIAASGSGFTQSNTCGAQLAASASCTISVAFTPASATAVSGLLTITDNAQGTAGSIQTVALAGTGTAPSVTVSPSSINFGSAVPGTPATSQTVVVTNSGNAPLTITNFLITGNSGTVFTLSTTCSKLLAAGANCNVTLGFNPATATTYNASFNLVDNANNVAGSTQMVALTGVGAYLGSFTLSPTTSPVMTVAAGDAANYTILVSPVGSSYGGPVTFAVTGAPQGGMAVFTPPSVVPGAMGGSTNLLIESPIAQLKMPGRKQRSLPVWALVMPFTLLAFGSFRNKLRNPRGLHLLLMLVIASLSALAGCGSSNLPGPVKSTSYPLTITGTCGVTQSTTTVTLIVQHY